jgi:hypothetical protein
VKGLRAEPMDTMKRGGLSLASAILLATLAAFQSGKVYCQTSMDRGQINPPGWGRPHGPVYIPPNGYGYGPCYPFASCSAYQQFQILERRRERSEELAREQSPQTRNDFPLNPRGGEAAITSDADVQPDFLESGQIRDEYHDSGDLLPEFVDGRGRPVQ